MEALSTEIRHGFRRLRQAPGFSVIAILTLALGIGANTAIFSLVDGIVIDPLPYPEAHRLVGVWHVAPGLGTDDELEQTDASYLNYRANCTSFEEMALYTPGAMSLTGDAEPRRILTGNVTPSLERVLRISPAMGRWFTEQEGAPGAELVALIGHGLWADEYGSNPDVVGESIRLDGVSHQIIGVMQPDFDFPLEQTQAWVPLVIDPENFRDASFRYLGVARLRAGVSLQEADTEAKLVFSRQLEAYPGMLTPEMVAQAQLDVVLNPMKEDIVGEMGSVLWILLGTVSLVLLIACANVANLFLVRSEGRQNEVAIRVALGAGRNRIVRYFLTESVLLGLLGGMAGVLLAVGVIRLVVALDPEGIPRLGEVGLDLQALAFTAAISLLAGCLFGAVPILRSRSAVLVAALKEGGRGGTTGRARNRTRNCLVSAQVALALVLLVGSGLMVRSFWQLQSVDPGFEPANTLTLNLSLPDSDYGDNMTVAHFLRQVVERVETLPGVQSAGTIHRLPVTSNADNNGTMIEDYPVPEGDLPPVHPTRIVSPGYFRAQGIPLLAGRAFGWVDVEEVTRPTLVSAAFAERYWPQQDAIGKRIRAYSRDDPWFTIVGIVGDVRHASLREPHGETIYWPLTGRQGHNYHSLVVRAEGPPLALVGAVREIVWAIDPALPIAEVQTMDQVVADSMARTSFAMLMLGIAAAVALLMGAIGIYGVISYVVSQRLQEIGIRMALGARAEDVSRMVMKQGVFVVGAGIVLGIVGALALTRFLEAMLFDVSALDPTTFVAVPAMLVSVAALATFLPARRAARVDPATALRRT
jgi:putative ABC transport system permease protein